ncbi:MAG TPA: hypothetical protein VK009_27210, partial [Chloroflexota bacterium]|nr:hypothetical protein [Chloroflexota bacterium]
MTSIDLPNAKNQAAAVSYDGSLEAVYVARDGQLDVVDTAKKAVFKTVASLPHATAVTQDGSSVYVLAPGSQIEVVRKSDWTKEGDVSLPEPAVGSMWLDGKQDKLFVPTQQGNVLTLAGGGTPQVLGSTAVGQHLGAIAGSAGA